ncbi:non-reducing end alpha-L-arabinofuranosidase family hydrolase [Gynuella sunshinyii]|uniref:Beta-xylanase n=1 Tax=Gynuella sunshinyii YC6258 TaxID=1445510 RepID=A0A0C5VK03_9GAMM|nr:non-reducing end alpha-L-arabinofuranosidase family hydrolase [Gynuella sunshinyii]AJQ95007.1 beta-1,4-xylanase [Gynuella sunshinyii YC6258]
MNSNKFVKKRLVGLLLASMALSACNVDIVDSSDPVTDSSNNGGSNSSGSDNGSDGSGSPGNNNGGDSGSDNGSNNGGDSGSDNGSNNGGDSGSDNGSNNGGDSGSDNGSDNGGDSGSDNGSDNGGDSGSDNGSDNGGDSGSDNGSDNGGDSGSDNGSDNGGDSGSDNGSDNGGDSGGNGNGSPSDDYQVPANNFAVNGDVENNLTNWGTTAGEVSRSTSVKHGGSASAYITNRTSAWNGLTFDVGKLTQGNEYEVAVWVKLPEGSYDTVITLTAKRADDSDSSTYNEYTNIEMVTANDSEWTLLKGYYTQTGTDFEHFIIESPDTTISFYADDFSIGGEVADDNNGGNSGSDSSHRFFVGNITTSGSVRSDFAQYWDQITPENEGKWGSVEGTRDSYNWGGLDAAYNYAKQNNILFKQHTFVWGSQYPSWIDSLSPSEQAAEIEEWIRDFCTRYPDVDMIDVVNEATPGHAPAGYAKSAFGDDWIIKSFQLARQYCPNATLILNDYNVLTWNTDAFISMAKPAVEAGVVDAIGLQAHGFESWATDKLETNLNKIVALGLPIYISEYDVAKTNDQEQLQIMQSQFPMMYNHPSVKGMTLWGYVYGKTWVEGSGLIREDGTQRPAMTWLLQYLKDNPKNNGGSDDNGNSNNDQTCDLPSSFSWTSTDPLITPHNSNWVSIKDPTIVKYSNQYHVFATVYDTAKNAWGGVYTSFDDWSKADSAQQVDMSATQAGSTVAPQVFYFEPHNKWYLIYQWGAKYSTNSDISNPSGWSAPKSLLSGGPSNGIDYWVICDDNYCYLFFSGDDGNLYRSKVSIGNFPNFSSYEIVMSDPSVGKLFEASNVYKVDGTNKYLLLVEAYGPRYFRSWTSTSLDGPWTPLADTQSNPFAGAANVTFSGQKWSDDISHGEMIRSGYNQKMTINACNMEYLYQGVDPQSGVSDYNKLPYKLGLIKAK